MPGPARPDTFPVFPMQSRPHDWPAAQLRSPRHVPVMVFPPFPPPRPPVPAPPLLLRPPVAAPPLALWPPVPTPPLPLWPPVAAPPPVPAPPPPLPVAPPVPVPPSWVVPPDPPFPPSLVDAVPPPHPQLKRAAARTGTTRDALIISGSFGGSGGRGLTVGDVPSGPETSGDTQSRFISCCPRRWRPCRAFGDANSIVHASGNPQRRCPASRLGRPYCGGNVPPHQITDGGSHRGCRPVPAFPHFSQGQAASFDFGGART